jgi:hypothetical protein
MNDSGLDAKKQSLSADDLARLNAELAQAAEQHRDDQAPPRLPRLSKPPQSQGAA